MDSEHDRERTSRRGDVASLYRAVETWGRGDALGARRACVAIAAAARRSASEADALLARAAEAGWSLATGRLAHALRAVESLPAVARDVELAPLLDLARAALWRLSGRRERALAFVESLGEPEPERAPLLAALVALERGIARSEIGDRERGGADLAAAARALRALALPRFEALALRALGATHLAGGEAAAALDPLREAVSLADATLDVAAGAAARSDLAVAQLLGGDLEGAAASARHAVTTWLGCEAQSEAPHAASWLRALWALAEAGHATEAAERMARHEARLESAGLPLLDHTERLLEAEIARAARDRARFERCARAAWEEASQSALHASDSVLGARISAAAAFEALRSGVAVEHVASRFADLAPAAFDEALIELLRDRGVERRLRALAWIGRRGGRAFEKAVRAAAKDRNPRVAAAAAALLPRLADMRETRLRVRSFGTLEVARDDVPVSDRAWRGAVTRRLFCRLLLAEGRPVARDELCEDLWPDVDPTAARAHLRVALSRLRRALDPESPPDAPSQLVQATGDALRLDLARVAWWDLRAFEELDRAARSAERDGGATGAIAPLREALALYTGPLLPDCRAEDWAIAVHARCAHRFREVAGRLGDLLLEAGDLDGAAAAAERLLRDDPADEDAAALRMRIHLARGEPSAALRVFEEARSALARLLAAEPGPALQALAARARAGPEERETAG